MIITFIVEISEFTPIFWCSIKKSSNDSFAPQKLIQVFFLIIICCTFWVPQELFADNGWINEWIWELYSFINISLIILCFILRLRWFSFLNFFFDSFILLFFVFIFKIFVFIFKLISFLQILNFLILFLFFHYNK